MNARRTLGFALVVVLGSRCRARGPEAGAPGAVATPGPAPTAAAAPAAADSAHARLVGRWLRSDADYAIAIAGVGPDGKLEARYLNPAPIHVARAESSMEGGTLRVLVELQDRGYPGSYYTLTYDPGSDSLTGVYHHLGLRQEFDVAFSRVSPVP